jgi:hypothetical protein
MQSIPRRQFMVRAAAVGCLWNRRAAAARPAGRIQGIEYKGVLVKDCTVAGETRSDDVTPAHPNGIPVSRDKWLLIYATRSFRGVDDDRSVIYQLRQGAPDGRVIREGLLVRSRSDWDPLGDGRTSIMQHGHPVAFGVPKGALIAGKPAPSANVFVAKWRKCARLYDKSRNYVEHGSKDPELERRTQAVEWVQFRLNAAEDDIEIIQPIRASCRRCRIHATEPNGPTAITSMAAGLRPSATGSM